MPIRLYLKKLCLAISASLWFFAMPRWLWRHGALAVPCLLTLSLVGALTFVPSATWIPQVTHPCSARHLASPGPKMAISDEEGTKSAADTAKRNVASLYGRSCTSAFPGLMWDVEACKQLNMEFARRTNMVCVFVCVCNVCVYNVYMCVRARVPGHSYVHASHTQTNTHTHSRSNTNTHTQKFKTNTDGRPAVPGWYLLSDYQRLFEGVEAEEDEESVEISGTIPRGLNGVYFVTGPGIFLQDDRTVHPFDGHGLVRRFEIDGRRGKVSFKSRFVRTPVFERETATLKSKRGTNARCLNAGLNVGAIPILQRGIGTNVEILRNVLEGRFGEFLLVHRNPSNTWCVCDVCIHIHVYIYVHTHTHTYTHTHAHTHTHTCIHTHAHTSVTPLGRNKLLSSYEGGLPFLLDADSLETLGGARDFGSLHVLGMMMIVLFIALSLLFLRHTSSRIYLPFPPSRIFVSIRCAARHAFFGSHKIRC
jgi:hypothetical protein